MTRAVRGGGAPAFTPAALFADGQQGVWYEPKPEYLFQDAAGTVPVTADGDPVGYMQDLSGNGNHATQSTSAARPVYHTDGVLHWLAPDGVDDFLLAGDAFNIAAFTAFGAVLGGSDSNQRLYDTRGTGVAGTARGFQIKPYLEVDNDGFIVDEQNGSTNDSLSFSTDLSVTKVFSASFKAGGAFQIREGGVVLASATPTMTDVVSERVSCLFANSNGQDSQLFNGRFYGGVVVEGIPSFSEPETYLANLAGVTL